MERFIFPIYISRKFVLMLTDYLAFEAHNILANFWWVTYLIPMNVFLYVLYRPRIHVRISVGYTGSE